MKFRFVLLDPDDESRRLEQGDVSALPAVRGRNVSYERRGPNIIRVEQRKNGDLKTTVLTNFYARIVRDIVLDDGEERDRHFGLEVKLGGSMITLSLPAAEFSRMGWVLNKLGPQAIVYPGQHQHARAAIQWLSAAIRQERVFTHLGWTKHGPDWVYLHADGAVGAKADQCRLQTRLPAVLQHYKIPSSPGNDERMEAVRASLRCLSLAPDRISFPLLAAVYRAPLGNVDFSLFLTGRTGTFKTTIAAICQQHFGAEMDAGNLPGNFASTANALETLSFVAKDALLVVDDFVPTGGSGDNALHGLAERLFRGAGNRQGRSRMGGNGHLRSSRPPRALILATGEEVPGGQSLRARMLMVEVAPGDVNRRTLNECQHAAQQGLLASSMAAFLVWIAGRYEETQRLLKARAQELRSLYSDTAHARLPTALAELQSGFEIWLQFALEIGAISATEYSQLEQRNVTALHELAGRQTKFHLASDPALRFFSLLRIALLSGQAHAADRRGKRPECPEIWGWRREQSDRTWLPQGPRIGWVAEDDLFLDPSTSYQVAQQVAGTERLAVGEQTIRQRLHERGLLASTDSGRQMLQVRRTLERSQRQVIHLKTSSLMG